MDLYESLLMIYDIRKGCHSQHKDSCTINEHAKNATFHNLCVQDNGAQMDKFDTNYVASFPCITEDISSVMRDSSCDGVIVIKGQDDKEHLVFVELKSKQSPDSLSTAFCQTVFTFFKYHQLLSVCNGYKLPLYTLDIVLACHSTDINEDAENYYDVQDEQILSFESTNKNFVADILPVLMKNKKCSLKLGELDRFENIRLNDSIMDIPITLHLATSKTPTDDSATISFSY